MLSNCSYCGSVESVYVAGDNRPCRMANAVELQVVQQEIEDARKEISGIKTSLGRAKTEKEAEYYLGQLTSLQSQMASLRSEKVLLLQAQQRGDRAPFHRVLCNLVTPQNIHWMVCVLEVCLLVDV